MNFELPKEAEHLQDGKLRSVVSCCPGLRSLHRQPDIEEFRPNSSAELSSYSFTFTDVMASVPDAGASICGSLCREGAVCISTGAF